MQSKDPAPHRPETRELISCANWSFLWPSVHAGSHHTTNRRAQRNTRTPPPPVLNACAGDGKGRYSGGRACYGPHPGVQAADGRQGLQPREAEGQLRESLGGKSQGVRVFFFFFYLL